MAIKTTLARQDDGTIQLTLTIPYEEVKGKREEALNHMIETLEIPGFRKGKAPRDVALKHIEQQELYNHTLQHILPEAYAQAVEEHKLRPILPPRFELIKIGEGEDWVIRATTCELPEVNLGDYKKDISGLGRAGGEPTREEKEQRVLKTLLETTVVKIPKLLVEEEVNHRLAQLLDQVQRLGMSVEQYLGSTGRNVEQIKQEYERTARDAIKLEVVLNSIADQEKVQVEEKEVEDVISVSGTPEKQKTLDNPQQKALIRSVLRRRKALDKLVNLL